MEIISKMYKTIMGNVSFFFLYKKRDVIDVVFQRRFLDYDVNSTSLVLSWRLTYSELKKTIMRHYIVIFIMWNYLKVSSKLSKDIVKNYQSAVTQNSIIVKKEFWSWYLSLAYIYTFTQTFITQVSAATGKSSLCCIWLSI